MRYVVRDVIGHTHDHEGYVLGRYTQPGTVVEIDGLYYSIKYKTELSRQAPTCARHTRQPPPYPGSKEILPISTS